MHGWNRFASEDGGDDRGNFEGDMTHLAKREQDTSKESRRLPQTSFETVIKMVVQFLVLEDVFKTSRQQLFIQENSEGIDRHGVREVVCDLAHGLWRPFFWFCDIKNRENISDFWKSFKRLWELSASVFR